MTAEHADQILGGYLRRLELEAASLPRARREELMTDITGHIAEARRGLSDETDADLLNLVDRLGNPAELVQDAGAAPGNEARSPTSSTPGVLEGVGVLLLLFFWPVGIAICLFSAVFTVRDKMVLAAIPVLLAALSLVTSRGMGHVMVSGLFLLFTLTPVLSAIYAGGRMALLTQQGRAAARADARR